jgi:AcrR family transcriptional regulator
MLKDFSDKTKASVHNRRKDEVVIHRPLDPRVQRTRQVLQEALLQLLIEHEYEGITVADITEQASVGRTTFYLHYHDKDELLSESTGMLMRSLMIDVEEGEDISCPEHAVRIFQHVAQRRRLYQALLREHEFTNIGDLMRSYFVDLSQRVIMRDLLASGNLSPLSGELISAHSAGSLFNLICWWLTHDASPSAEKMGAFFWQLIEKAVTAYIAAPSLDE